MRRSILPLASAFAIMLMLVTCSAGDRNERPAQASPLDFNSYWYDGFAELNHYKLEQARYGEVHPGDAVLIFVTEDFLAEEQVKYEGYGDSEHISVLKLNAMREFTTGLYQYNMMNSVFAPVDTERFPHALKLTGSSLDWCGQSFLQLNNRKDKYNIQQLSYFQQEGDKQYELTTCWLEDELWTRLRMDPTKLPQGEVRMMPGASFMRLKHVEPKCYTANVSSKEEARGGRNMLRIEVNYPELDRMLTIRADAAVPHVIQGWEETYTSGFGPEAQKLTTKATLTHTQKRKYWEEHDREDMELRKGLGLE